MDTLRTIIIAASVVACVVGASGTVADGAPQTNILSTGCAPAAIATVELPTAMTVDEIDVVVADGSPASGAAAVSVHAGAFDRVVQVRGDQSRSLQFSPALRGARFDVSLDPVFEAPTGVCVDRIILRRAGVQVAVVRPR